MAKTRRDPSIGTFWLAWYAITEGDEPVECAFEYLAEARDKLVDLSKRLPGRLTDEDVAFLSGDLKLLLVGLEAAAKPGGDTYHRLKLSRRGRRPNYFERAKELDAALAQFELLRAAKWKVNPAAEEIERRTGVSRSLLLDWRSKTRRMMAQHAQSARPSSR